jgi:predicted Ser/Thr protein kinase
LKFGKFEILAELGQGAMGKVYRAQDPILDRPVALKTVSPALLTGKDTLARFRREARAAARLQHPNIVTIYELGEVEGTHYIAMELIEGMELGEALTPTDRFTVEQKVRMMVEVCRGLDFAHKMGVIHRDVKPANILVSADGSVKLLDFGIARFGESDMTQTGMVLGTPSYISPELLQGAKVDRRADMWAVGVILYEVLSGRRPFEAKTIGSIIHKIIHEPLPAIDGRGLGLPESLVAVVSRALDRDPEQRFPDLGALAGALLAAIGATPPPETPLDPAVRMRGYELNFAEARRLLAGEDLSGALEAARRAKSLEPARTGIVTLIKVIEERLAGASTIRRAPRAGWLAEAASAAPAVTTAPPPTPSTGLPVALGPLDSAVLRARGAGALRDQGAFGEPPSTKEVALSPVADRLAVAGTDGGIRLWDLRSRTRVHVYRTALHQRSGHDAAALALAFSPDGSLLASGHVDGAVHLWDVTKGEAVPVKLRHDGAVGTLAFSPDGATLATGSQDSNLRLWDVGAAVGGDGRRVLVRQPSAVTALAWGAGGEWVLTGHMTRVLRLIDPLRSRLLATLRGPAAQVTLLELSPDGRYMAVGSRDRMVRLIDLSSREEVAALALPRSAAALSFLADGAFLATVTGDNAVQLWDLETRTPAATLWGPSGETFVGLALFGEWNHLAVALGDGRIRTWGPAA